MVRPESAFVVPPLKENALTALLPLIISQFVPGPAMTVLSVTCGRGEARVIVPLVVKRMVSLPGLLLAATIACRSDPGPESLVVVTVKLAPRPANSAKLRTTAANNVSLISQFSVLLH